MLVIRRILAATRLSAAPSRRLHLAIARPMAAMALAIAVIAASAAPAAAGFVSSETTIDPKTGAITTVTETGTTKLGTATLVNPIAWTSGFLASYLGISASAATGFYVYQVDLGDTILHGPNFPNTSPLLSLSGSLPTASYVTGFVNVGTTKHPYWIASANSGAILEQVPEPASLALLSASLVGFGLAYRRRGRR